MDHLFLPLLSLPLSPLSVSAQGLSSAVCKQGLCFRPAHDRRYRTGTIRLSSVDVRHRRALIVALIDGTDHEVLVRFPGGGCVR